MKYVLRTSWVTGNALALVKRVHEPAYLWDITFCTRWFWGFWYYVHPLVLRPRALFYRTDCTRRSKFLTHALGHVDTIFRSFFRFVNSISLPNCIFFRRAVGISAYVNTICKLNKSMFGKHQHFILWYTYLHQVIIAHFYFSFIYITLSSQWNKVKKIPKLFYQLALEWIKLLLRRTKRGKKDPETTKETVVHPFLVVCNKLSCQYHWNLISRVSFKEN